MAPIDNARPASGSSLRREQRRATGSIRVRALGVGVATFVAAGGGLLAVAPNALAASSAPTHGTATCAVAGDECSNAIAYANAHDGGGASVLAVEADTEAHGGTVTHRVFDIRMQTNNGIYVVYVLRNDTAPYNDGVWWQSLAESQSGGSGSNPPPNSTDTSPDASNSPDASSPDTSPDQPAPQPAPPPSTSPNGPQISSAQASSNATNFATSQGYQVLGVKNSQLNNNTPKDYYQVKLQLGQNGRNAGTTTVWVDASSSAGIVTAASGSGLSYRDSAIVAASTAQANAVSAAGGLSSKRCN